MLGQRLKELREKANMTQNDLAKKVNLSQQTIGHYEVGRAKPDIETLDKLAAIFDVSVDYLLGRTDVRQQPKEGPEVLAAHRTDGYGDPLPQEALEELERFKAYIRHKYRHWKPGMTQSEYLKKYGGDGEGGD